jgi:hypothetical protein
LIVSPSAAFPEWLGKVTERLGSLPGRLGRVTERLGGLSE